MSTGMMLEDSTVEAQTVEANIGNLAGHLVDASFTGTSLTTIAQDEGVLMEGTPRSTLLRGPLNSTIRR